MQGRRCPPGTTMRFVLRRTAQRRPYSVFIPLSAPPFGMDVLFDTFRSGKFRFNKMAARYPTAFPSGAMSSTVSVERGTPPPQALSLLPHRSGIERPENSPVDCFQRDGAGRPVEKWPEGPIGLPFRLPDNSEFLNPKFHLVDRKSTRLNSSH